MRDRIGIVHGAGVTMRSLVDDILDVAKMETGNLIVESAPVDLRTTLNEVTRIWQEQAGAKGLAFHLEIDDAPHWIQSDAGRLRQIVFNLLSNAIKFTERGAITLRVTQARGDAPRLNLAVADTGIGIPAEKFEEIFESFRQADSSTTRQFGGTGLGLTICRNLARALGGDISVTSVAGQGSTFLVDLPLVVAEPPVVEAGPAKGGGAMLIVDRNPIARSMLRTVFESRAAQLQFASSAAEAITILEEGGVTRILLDEATLKAGEGELLDSLRSISVAAGSALVVILCSKLDPETKLQLMDVNSTEVLERPIAGAALVEIFFPEIGENSTEGGADPLVSQAA
jgi:CheY-like chemotaxis protein/two-component sensor histidine kinase